MNVDLADPQFEEPQHEHCTSTRNACKLCTPLGACLVFRGIALLEAKQESSPAGYSYL